MFFTLQGNVYQAVLIDAETGRGEIAALLIVTATETAPRAISDMPIVYSVPLIFVTGPFTARVTVKSSSLSVRSCTMSTLCVKVTRKRFAGVPSAVTVNFAVCSSGNAATHMLLTFFATTGLSSKLGIVDHYAKIKCHQALYKKLFTAQNGE
jgi:hypothetical protein